MMKKEKEKYWMGPRGKDHVLRWTRHHNLEDRKKKVRGCSYAVYIYIYVLMCFNVLQLVVDTEKFSALR